MLEHSLCHLAERGTPDAVATVEIGNEVNLCSARLKSHRVTFL